MRSLIPLTEAMCAYGANNFWAFSDLDNDGRFDLLRRIRNMEGSPFIPTYFVDAINGSDTDAKKPYATMGACITAVNAACTAASTAWRGARILLTGLIAEATMTLTAPNVTFVGTDPNYGAAVSTGFGTVWMEAATDATELLILSSAALGCKFMNITFRPPRFAAANNADYTKGVGVRLDAAHGAQFIHCRFQGRGGSTAGINLTNATADVKIIDCEFMYFNTLTYGCAIHCVMTATGSSNWLIKGCDFHSNVKHIQVPLKQSRIMGCTFPAGGLQANSTYSATMTAVSIDIFGTNGTYNVVTANLIGSLYHTTGGLFGPATGDEWSGNMCVDRSHATQVDAGSGWSILAPAA